MEPEQMRHEANVAAGMLKTDANTEGSRALATRFVVASDEAKLSYGENAFAAAWLLSTMLGTLTLTEQAVMLSSIGNLAIDMHLTNNAAALALAPLVGQA